MSRPRGYSDWKPQAATRQLIGQVQSVLDEYSAHLPLTVRQIFYRLVGAYGYEKTEKAYARLCEHMVRARRAEMIGFNVIRDDGVAAAGGDWGYHSPEAFWEEIRDSAQGYRRPRLEGQPVRMELWCEAKGMVPQLQRVAQPYGVQVFATGGFSSVTVTYDIAQRALREGVGTPTVFLHVGDYDPSGESIFDAMSEDAHAFILGEGGSYDQFVPERVALTEAQVIEHDLPTAPPKDSDSRSVNWIGDTCQAEAMPPDLLASTVKEAIEDHLDLKLMAKVRKRGDEERAELIKRLERVMDAEGDDE